MRATRRLFHRSNRSAIAHGAMRVASRWRKQKSHDRNGQKQPPDDRQDAHVSGPFRLVVNGAAAHVEGVALGVGTFGQGLHSRTLRNRAALVITLTEDRAIAAAAIIGESKIPKKG